MDQARHKQWLHLTAIVIGGFGPVFSLGAMLGTSEPARLTLDILSWPVDGSVDYGAPTTRFLSALTGGFLLGWGVTIWMLARYVHDAAPEGVRKCVVYGLLTWFAVDSAGSVLSGNAANALFNVAVLLIAVGPLWRPATNQR